MDFRGFLGNEDLKARLDAAFSAGRVSHCYLLCGPEGAGKRTLAKLLCAAMECTGGGKIPCGTCSACRKVLTDQHPDVITVADPDHKQISVDVIRNMRADAFIRPNEGTRKIYVIAQDMGVPAQNALLKILEEPPEYAAFLLLSDRAEKLLTTIRSRCQELHLSPVDEQTALPFLHEQRPDKDEIALRAAYARAGGFLGQALTALDTADYSEQVAQFASGYAARDTLRLAQWLIPMEKWKREQLLPIMEELRRFFCDALAARCGQPNGSQQIKAVLQSRTGSELLAAGQSIDQAIEYLNANVSAGAVVGWLTLRLK